uniref:Uncharacterized protein n=1 Tax=Cryptomonas curvata TaxID=233186 RepID=A0A7S0QJA5_9CRYP|mmetsp:Transcript_28413/g.59407  ORF Transcript_28413/g.59407 Transcript_28413/m.59407 type:complete len:103 (+) Transcript_28413:345-653(+)
MLWLRQEVLTPKHGQPVHFTTELMDMHLNRRVSKSFHPTWDAKHANAEATPWWATGAPVRPASLQPAPKAVIKQALLADLSAGAREDRRLVKDYVRAAVPYQ